MVLEKDGKKQEAAPLSMWQIKTSAPLKIYRYVNNQTSGEQEGNCLQGSFLFIYFLLHHSLLAVTAFRWCAGDLWQKIIFQGGSQEISLGKLYGQYRSEGESNGGLD